MPDFLEELIKSAKDRLKIDVLIAYGKSEIQQEEIHWLQGLPYVRTSFCKNFHAKCYLNEETCIITSLNLYEFSQVNTNEIGVLLTRADDAGVYREAYEEAQRIIRISDEVRISLERINAEDDEGEVSDGDGKHGKLTTSKLGIKTDALLSALAKADYLSFSDGKHTLTDKGAGIGGEFVPKSRFGASFLWPNDLQLQ